MNPEDARALTLGDPVRFTGYLTRTSHWPTKAWQLVSHPGEGVVVGRRTYSNGHNIDAGDAISYVVDERFPVVLVAFALHRAIVAVPPEHLEQDGGIWKPSHPAPLYEQAPLFALEDFA